MISFLNPYPPLMYGNCNKYRWMGLMLTGIPSNFILVTEDRMSSPSWSTLAVVPFMCYRVPCKQNWLNQIGKLTKWKIWWIMGRYLYQGKWLWYFFFAFLRDQMGWGWTHCCTRNLDMEKYFSGCEVLAFMSKSKRQRNSKTVDTLVKYHTDKIWCINLEVVFTLIQKPVTQ